MEREKASHKRWSPVGSGVSRRSLLKAGVAVPLAVAQRSVGAPGPSDRLRVMAVGVGGMGKHYLRGCGEEIDAVALCDLDHGFARGAFGATIGLLAGALAIASPAAVAAATTCGLAGAWRKGRANGFAWTDPGAVARAFAGRRSLLESLIHLYTPITLNANIRATGKRHMPIARTIKMSPITFLTPPFPPRLTSRYRRSQVPSNLISPIKL